MILSADFEARTVEVARRLTDDIAECEAADISIFFIGQLPLLKFVFGDKRLIGRPALHVQLITESRKNPLAPGRVIQGDALRRHVRESVEAYFKLNGIQISMKAVGQS